VFRFITRSAPAPAPAPALYVAATYMGCTDGWVANGGPRSLASAERLAALIERIRPDYITRPIAA